MSVTLVPAAPARLAVLRRPVSAPAAGLLLRAGTLYRLDSATGPLVRLLDVSACGQFARVENRRFRFRHETRAGRLVVA